MSVNSKMTAIADAIRAKTGKTATLTLDQMVTEIEGITGGTELFAAIGVTYQDGAAISCISDNTEVPPIGKDGQCIFAIPFAGTWTVTVSDGGISKSKNIIISTKGQVETVILELFDYVIYNGNLRPNYEIVTTTATYEVVDGALVFKSTIASSGNGSITIKENGQAIDLTNRSTLKFDTAATSPRSGTLDYVQWGVSGASTVKKNLGVANPVERQIISVDISKLSSGSISLFISDNPATVELKIYDVWFE